MTTPLSRARDVLGLILRAARRDKRSAGGWPGRSVSCTCSLPHSPWRFLPSGREYLAPTTIDWKVTGLTDETIRGSSSRHIDATFSSSITPTGLWEGFVTDSSVPGSRVIRRDGSHVRASRREIELGMVITVRRKTALFGEGRNSLFRVPRARRSSVYA